MISLCYLLWKPTVSFGFSSWDPHCSYSLWFGIVAGLKQTRQRSCWIEGRNSDRNAQLEPLSSKNHRRFSQRIFCMISPYLSWVWWSYQKLSILGTTNLISVWHLHHLWPTFHRPWATQTGSRWQEHSLSASPSLPKPTELETLKHNLGLPDVTCSMSSISAILSSTEKCNVRLLREKNIIYCSSSEATRMLIHSVDWNIWIATIKLCWRISSSISVFQMFFIVLHLIYIHPFKQKTTWSTM